MFLHFSAIAAAFVSLFLGNHQAPLITPLQVRPHTVHHQHVAQANSPIISGLTIQTTPSLAPEHIAEVITDPNPTTTPIPTSIPSPTPTETPSPTSTPIPTTTPTPTATPTPAPVVSVPTPADLDTLFAKYADQYHADKNLMEKIAKCESSFNSNASYMDYLGMFQFGPSSWSNARTAMGADPNPDLRTNPEESIKTAAYVIGNGGASAWPSCNK